MYIYLLKKVFPGFQMHNGLVSEASKFRLIMVIELSGVQFGQKYYA